LSGGTFGAEGRPVLGPEGQEPNVYMTNIGPHGRQGGEAGGVEFLVHTESNAPVDVMVTFTVSTPSRARTCSAEDRRCRGPADSPREAIPGQRPGADRSTPLFDPAIGCG
jgi:hypothetical protein